MSIVKRTEKVKIVLCRLRTSLVVAKTIRDRVLLPFNLYPERSHLIFVPSQIAQTLRENLRYYKMAFFRRRLWNLKLSEKKVR